ncbi:hypothetical protein GCM10022225_67880 [Plantactinospora mayteni]|uniref:CorA-like Mg2+ transporter protein n=1 Tax=Plantactinospora mayteni TaxID=566021 RepID=A0ABQ4EVB4_9ACTN|nr:hypothetical protein [Plantactinospora mayteni]GIG98588.1 hypothetical protein Pma05_51610 [Plantactinospora mayteni]
MTQLRILAPVVVDYYAVPGSALRDPEAHARFWAERESDLDALLPRLAPQGPAEVAEPAPGTDAASAPAGPPPVVVLKHTRPRSSLNLYRSISAHAAERTLHVLTGRLRPEHLSERPGDPRWSGLVEISFRLYDHGLMLLEMLAEVDPWLTGPTDRLPARLDELQARAVELGERTAREVVRRYLDPVLALLRAADRDEAVLHAATPADDPVTAEFGEVLWVTRSLVVDPSGPGAEEMTRHWVKDVVTGDDRAPADRLLDGDLDHLVRWLNYLFLDRTGAGARMLPGDPFRDQWEALRYAQVFYGVLERIDARLSRILADSAAAGSRWELERLKGQLTRLSQRAELIIMERQDLSKYLKRAVRVEMDAILDFWDYEKLLEQPVHFKIELCGRRLAELAARRTARSAMFTDLILLGIAMTSILGTALAVTEFGRSIASDPEMAAYDLGRSALVAWVASQPADAILITSGVVSALLVIVYLFFRRDRSA